MVYPSGHSSTRTDDSRVELVPPHKTSTDSWVKQRISPSRKVLRQAFPELFPPLPPLLDEEVSPPLISGADEEEESPPQAPKKTAALSMAMRESRFIFSPCSDFYLLHLKYISIYSFIDTWLG